MSNEEKKEQEVVRDEDQLLTEEPSSRSFGVVQGFFWGTIKSVVLMLLIVGLVWLIWGDGWRNDNHSKEPFNEGQKIIEEALNLIPKNITSEIPSERPPDYYTSQKENQNTTEKKQTGDVLISEKADQEIYLEPVTYTDPTLIIRRSFNIEVTRKAAQQSTDIFSQSVRWLKLAKNIGEVSPQILRIQNPKERAQKIESLLVQSEKILISGNRIKESLRKNLYTNQQNINKYQQKSEVLNQEIFQNIALYREKDLKKLILEKIEIDQRLSQSQNLYKYYESFYKNIENYQRIIRQKQIPLIAPSFELQNPQ